MSNLDSNLIFETYTKVNEGLFDRAKANVAGAVGSVKGLGQQVAGTVKGAVAGAQGNVGGVQQAQQQVQAGKTTGAIAKAESYKATALKKIDKLTAEIMNDLQFDFNLQYDEKDSIGKRYRRQDAIGTPFSITIDHQTLEDNMVTVRDRDTMLQQRISVSEIASMIENKASWKTILSNL
jgi:histidyl-tRNA synthetase